MDKQNSSYKQIIKSTSIFGGSQLINIIIGFARSKIIALLLGSTGVGLIGIYQSIVDMVRSIACMGIDTGGIREVAAINSTHDRTKLEELVAVIRWWILGASIFGSLVCIIFCYPISIWAFESGEYTLPIALLSIAVFFTLLNLGQIIVIQGTRQIPSLVKANIISNTSSLLLSVPIYYFLGLKGIAISLVLGSIATFLITQRYYNKLRIKHIPTSSAIALRKGKKILKLGLFVVSASVCATVSMFVIRSFISNNVSLEAAGLFQAVWTITGVYLMLILRSMGSDFFPRLSGIINKNVATRRLVNEQTFIVLIAATPLIVGMILFSKLALIALYSHEFVSATSLLQWQILGTFLKVISWPMGFILLAKTKGTWYLYSEVLFYIVYLLASYLLYPHYGLDAVGIGYLLSYAFYLVCMLIMSNRLCRFRWTSEILSMSLISFSFILVSFYMMHRLDGIPAYLTTSVIFILSITYSLYKLNKIINIKDILKDIKLRIPFGRNRN
ncbi:O-antigen translocase [Dysgonomonas sp. 520]|uniref:O-antigen translocase n=1 Tax=Dysgonomonas sp. 520 TaxID=2302931 RepID=UPI0013D6AA3A|nr:O-antigen translocase [Dysgonomonas sp. 520]